MKNIRNLWLAVTALCCATVSAHDFEVDGIYYNITSETDLTVEVTYRGENYSSYSDNYTGEVVIPESVIHNGNAYSVTSIGDDAFYKCSSLTNISIPESVTSIGDDAFYKCSGLTNITVDENNTTYDSRESCNAIIETSSNTLIAGCQSTLIPNSVTSIGDKAFYGCSQLTSITIPESVTSIGYWAFEGCFKLANITVGKSVTSIGQNAFVYTEWWINQPDGLIYLDNYLLGYNGNNLTGEIQIKDGTKIIGDCAFYGSNLTSVIIPESVTSIGERVFYYSDLTSIFIPKSVTNIGEAIFFFCSNLTSIIVDENNTTYDSRENCNAIIETSSNTLITGCQSTLIPNSVTNIGKAAFSHCYGLTNITIPNSVTDIGYYAFSDCRGLTNITIPNSVTNIGKGTFSSCSGLMSVTLGDSVTSIGELAFYGCTNLTQLICNTTTPPSCEVDALNGINTESCLLKVPAGSKSAYQHAEQWNDFYTIEEFTTAIEGILLDEATTADVYTIDGRLYMKNANVKEIKLPRGLYIIGGKKVMVK